MTSTDIRTWQGANQRYLMARLQTVRTLLERYTPRGREGAHDSLEEGSSPGESAQNLTGEWQNLKKPPALDTICTAFAFSPFERDLLLLCAGIDLDSKFAVLCAEAHGDSGRRYPTFGLALAVLPEPHWSALTPRGPLRRWRFIDMGAGDSLTSNPLRLDECILHYLCGVPHVDERLVGLIEPVQATADGLSPFHQAVADQMEMAWSGIEQGHPLPAIQLRGADESSRRAVAQRACARLGARLYSMSERGIPSDLREVDALVRLWQREAILSQGILMVECDDTDGIREHPGEIGLQRLIQSLPRGFIVSGGGRGRSSSYPLITLELAKPSIGEQRKLWQEALGDSFGPELDGVLGQFRLSRAAIRAASMEALTNSRRDGPAPRSGELRESLWDACRRQSQSRLDHLAQKLDPFPSWEDLILPEAQKRLLDEIVVHVRRRVTVYEEWGFAGKGTRGLGITALFAGPSGTGKTMAAEVLARELKLDLYRIDLSQVVSKYIGETEKNLRRVFEAAEEGGAILLFDEADALFGKRSEVKDSHDRYANIEVSYLLQGMEAYRGLAILTTNQKSSLDAAFLRRLRFVVHFPFPDAAQRAAIWSGVFPPQTPTENLDIEALARLNVAGGNIRNIALYAAFLAADQGEPLRMEHLARGAQVEYAKLDRPLAEASESMSVGRA